MKRFTAGAIVVSLLCSALLACGRDSPPTSPKNLKPPPTLRHDAEWAGAADLYTVDVAGDDTLSWQDAACIIATHQVCDPLSEADKDALLATALLLIYANDGNPLEPECLMVGTNMLMMVAYDRYRWARVRPLGSAGVDLYHVPSDRPFDMIGDQVTVFSPELKSAFWEQRFVAVHETAHMSGLNSYDLDPEIRRIQNDSVYQPMAQMLEAGCWY